MPLPTVPDWLKLRDGSLSPGISDSILFVVLGGQPQYRLNARPAGGQCVCEVTQTNNGKQLGDVTKHATPAAAFAGGLEALRTRLGW